jgi:hypothetical protein
VAAQNASLSEEFLCDPVSECNLFCPKITDSDIHIDNDNDEPFQPRRSSGMALVVPSHAPING